MIEAKGIGDGMTAIGALGVDWSHVRNQVPKLLSWEGRQHGQEALGKRSDSDPTHRTEASNCP